MADLPLVSVVIPNYNYQRYLGKAIDSALGQGYPRLEVVVVDDGSTDGSRAVISAYDDRVRPCFQENCGLPAARNRGIERAEGKFLLFLDADDWLLPGGVAALVEGFARFPEAGLVFGDVEFTGDDDHVFARSEYAGERVPFDLLLRENPILVGGTLVRRSALAAVGLFNPAFRQCEDYDLWLRLALGHPICHVARTVARIRSHSEQLSGNVVRQLQWELRIKQALAASVRRPGMRRALGNVHHRLAYEYKEIGDFAGLRAHSLAAVGDYPWRAKYWLYLGASLLPAAWIQRLTAAGSRDWARKR